MNPRLAEIRDSLLLAVAVVLGAFVSSWLPLVGVPLVAAGITGLLLSGRMPWLYGGIAVGVATCGLADPRSLVYVVPALVAVLLAVVLLPRVNYQLVGAGVIATLGLAAAVLDSVVAATSHTTLAASLAKDAGVLTTEAIKAMGTAATPEVVAQMKDLTNTLVLAWPSSYFTQALIIGVFTVVTVAWASRRQGRPVPVPSLSQVDLTPHVLWPFVIGLLMLAAGHLAFGSALAVRAIGLNLVLGVHAVFALQGLAVAAGVLDRTRVGRGGRIFALAALVALDTVTLAVSFVGLLDFWVNFRRLPRDGASPSSPATAMSDRL